MFVSNCEDAPSNRLQLVVSLQKFMPVHVYGQCGRYRCAKYNNQHCLEMLQQNYMFYMAFENSLCEDYVTEKLFRVSDYYIVPVVFGGVDYNRFMPPKSYINAEDFNSTLELARFLNDLAANTAEYSKYFWWKEYYYINPNYQFCNLCQMLHQRKNGVKSQHYTDISKWFYKDTCRTKMNIILS